MTEQLDEEQIWMMLADLFFLDTEPNDADFDRVADVLKSGCWTREKMKKTLVQLIAPHAGVNLGYLLYPTIGEWTGFKSEWLAPRVRKSQLQRAQQASWRFAIQDWWCRKMLNKLQINRLLDRL